MSARILSIAGSDSGGGAGIQADIKSITMLGGHAMTAITAITAQNTCGVAAVHPIPVDMVAAQIDAILADIGVDAIKIGMLGSAEIANMLADKLAAIDVPIIFDPVMIATSGSLLADEATISAFHRMMDISLLVTPNLPELHALGGIENILRHDAFILAKGGHGEGKQIIDQLYRPNGTVVSWQNERIYGDNNHGTGCTLASAIACGMGQGLDIETACARAISFVRIAYHDAMTHPDIGAGHGPLGQQFVRNDAIFMGASLNQLTVNVRDYDASVLFYKGLGLRQIVDSPFNGYARFEADNGVTFSIHCANNGEEVSGAVIYFEHCQLDEWCAALQGAGYVFDQMPRDEKWGWREARLFDPSGNAICLYYAGENRRHPAWRIK
ncbi:bifunctional hydroxymethylpyrimidine kinase/phosphomethylpyrimidine kinase [Sphingorhabdus lutea]|uniref:hydroxymethylpyrimidine kinase n=1 Tax=Sphingorhabdus lutea TaxID=1913578 RepID=A0A1L3JCU9_9SPHN|nr:bifunctional hydroxymethylpyrimidine kinase/phosphomethylpyrimidine kinase [Sphingorhabdus lutea]APG62942.1 bifunctional hydroxymethylpyrimidine kinase/phosphomethylpyrimidine kinase [Sphingorhabdus lutea]